VDARRILREPRGHSSVITRAILVLGTTPSADRDRPSASPRTYSGALPTMSTKFWMGRSRPIFRPSMTKFDLVINLTTAKALEIPPTRARRQGIE
jgi:hypothetical protein